MVYFQVGTAEIRYLSFKYIDFSYVASTGINNKGAEWGSMYIVQDKTGNGIKVCFLQRAILSAYYTILSSHLLLHLHFKLLLGTFGWWPIKVTTSISFGRFSRNSDQSGSSSLLSFCFLSFQFFFHKSVWYMLTKNKFSIDNVFRKCPNFETLSAKSTYYK